VRLFTRPGTANWCSKPQGFSGYVVLEPARNVR
jgi:hypothetical protein